MEKTQKERAFEAVESLAAVVQAPADALSEALKKSGDINRDVNESLCEINVAAWRLRNIIDGFKRRREGWR